MTKKDLKAGMVVKLRDNSIGIILNTEYRYYDEECDESSIVECRFIIDFEDFIVHNEVDLDSFKKYNNCCLGINSIFFNIEDDYEDDLTYKHNSNYDIMKISNFFEILYKRKEDNLSLSSQCE